MTRFPSNYLRLRPGCPSREACSFVWRGPGRRWRPPRDFGTELCICSSFSPRLLYVRCSPASSYHSRLTALSTHVCWYLHSHYVGTGQDPASHHPSQTKPYKGRAVHARYLHIVPTIRRSVFVCTSTIAESSAAGIHLIYICTWRIR